jgi:hypothetical protein
MPKKKKNWITVSLQIIKAKLCGVLLLFIDHELRDLFSPWLAPELSKNGRPTLRCDPQRHWLYFLL